jgi:hypoxanthine-DNA glycosylase
VPEKLVAFPPIASVGARLLVLGSMPGMKSLQAQQYYAHPRNAFWPIMEQLFSIPADMDYAERCRRLADKGVALWDVINRCEREGSLDSAIKPATLEPNDFRQFFHHHARLSHVFFNGAKAEDVFNRQVLPAMGEAFPQLVYCRLPSTSPAYAALTFEAKLLAWRAIADALDYS